MPTHDTGRDMATAADATATFFDELGRREHDPLVGRLTATLRFDLVDGRKTDRWLVTVNKGDVTVEHRNGEADCVLRAERGVFGRLARGEQGAFAAILRGEVTLEGDPTRLVLAQRLFPGPAAATTRGRA